MSLWPITLLLYWRALLLSASHAPAMAYPAPSAQEHQQNDCSFKDIMSIDMNDQSPSVRGPATVQSNDTNHDTLKEDPWADLGGGAVNEKHRLRRITASSEPGRYDPSIIRSHLFHSLEGLHRYPNYLSRWSTNDMNELEKALEQQLQLVRDQRQSIHLHRSKMQELANDMIREDPTGRWMRLTTVPKSWDEIRDYVLDPNASRAVFSSPTFRINNRGRTVQPTIAEVLSGQCSVDLDVAHLTRLMDEECENVYSFPLLSAEFCREIREFILALMVQGGQAPAKYQEMTLGLQRPINLDLVQLGWINDLLFHLIVRPLCKHLFQSTESFADLDWRNGYVAGYSAQPTVGKARQSLTVHTDDSEVTLNVALIGDKQYEGGSLKFGSLRNRAFLDTTSMDEISQRPTGNALFHPGRQFHAVTPVTNGDRFVIILWARSWKGVRASACPCCWLNRRVDQSCICGPQWN